MGAWFVNLQGFEIGPVSEAELQKLVSSGRLTADGAVRRDGEEKWRLANTIPGLFTDGSADNHPADNHPADNQSGEIAPAVVAASQPTNPAAPVPVVPQPPVSETAAEAPPLINPAPLAGTAPPANPTPAQPPTAEPPPLASPVVATPAADQAADQGEDSATGHASPTLVEQTDVRKSLRPTLTRCTHCRRYMLAPEFQPRTVITCLLCGRPFQAMPTRVE